MTTNVVFDLGAVLLTWEPVSLVQTQLAPHAPTAEAAHALARQIFHHEDWLGFDRGTHSLDDAERLHVEKHSRLRQRRSARKDG